MARKAPECSSPNFTPSSVPNAKRGEPPQGWHGFRLLLRGYWAAWAGTREVRAWQKDPSWWAEGCQRWRLDWELNSSTREERGEGWGSLRKPMAGCVSAPLGHRMVCLPLPNACYPSASVTLG